MSIADGAADLTMSSAAMSYLAFSLRAATEMARVSRKGDRVVSTDLHPSALAAGLTRSFQSNGQAGPRLEWPVDACFDQDEREIFPQANNDFLSLESNRTSAVPVMAWEKP
jgi:hypothetical protein